ncbi:MAG: hypothetical protein JW843_01785 [Candidatus Aminicenantes bacterium]|nr:hypothetical protein [Candidatus Aminicenantes bacterium]
MKGPIRVLVPVLLVMLAAGTVAAQDFTKYHNYEETTAIVQGLAKSAPGLVKLSSLGKTQGNRDLWVLEIAQPGGLPLNERPGLLIAANFAGDAVFGSEMALAVADYIVKNASKPEVKACLDNAVVFIIPRMNPDGAEAMWASLKWDRRTNLSPYDDDNDGRTDEDGPEDLNGDGFITVMRVAEPGGTYLVDPKDARLLKKADPKLGEKGVFALYLEGRDNDGDGFINEDPPGGVNLNRNFMHEYPYFKPEAGRFMASESETRALLAWIVQHRNIAASLTFGENDNLISGGRESAGRRLDLLAAAEASIEGASKTGIFPALGSMRGMRVRGGGMEMSITPEMLAMLMGSGGGMFMMGGGPQGRDQAVAQTSGRRNMPARTAPTSPLAADLEYFRLVAAKYAEMTGIRQAPLTVKPEGAFSQYGYYQFGVPSFSTPGWGLPEAPRASGQGMMTAGGPGGGGQTMMTGRTASFQAGRAGFPGAAGSGASGGDLPQAVDKAILQWMDKEKIDGFVPWTKVKHPDLGEVEIGGFKPYAATNPPAATIAAAGRSHAEFALYLASLFPKVRIESLEAIGHGGGIYRIKAAVVNTGFWPTASAQGLQAQSVKPTMVQLQVDPETVLSGNPKTVSIRQALNGSGGRAEFEWLIRAKAGEKIALKVMSQKGGGETRTVVLK